MVRIAKDIDKQDRNEGRTLDGLSVSGIVLLPLDVGLHVEARDAGR
jgi:hypothetical protein